jgi:hypothetical protein
MQWIAEDNAKELGEFAKVGVSTHWSLRPF